MDSDTAKKLAKEAAEYADQDEWGTYTYLLEKLEEMVGKDKAIELIAEAAKSIPQYTYDDDER